MDFKPEHLTNKYLERAYLLIDVARTTPELKQQTALYETAIMLMDEALAMYIQESIENSAFNAASRSLRTHQMLESEGKETAEGAHYVRMLKRPDSTLRELQQWCYTLYTWQPKQATVASLDLSNENILTTEAALDHKTLARIWVDTRDYIESRRQDMLEE